VEADRRAWLERLAEACEKILAGDDATSMWVYDSGLMEDVRTLLAGIRAELDAVKPVPPHSIDGEGG
jgi:hypothetical protein